MRSITLRHGELLKDLARAEPSERAEAANASMGRSSNHATNVPSAPSPYAQAPADIGMSCHEVSA